MHQFQYHVCFAVYTWRNPKNLNNAICKVYIRPGETQYISLKLFVKISSFPEKDQNEDIFILVLLQNSTAQSYHVG